MGLLDQAATTLGGQGMGMLLGRLTEKHDDARQLRQQQALTNIQAGANEAAAEANYKRQLDMWNKTNYPAQVEQLKKAGLNPALLYGTSGGGGATVNAAQASGVSGGSAQGMSGEGMAMMNSIMNGQLIAAQTEALKAQANKDNATATKTAGADTELTKTTTASLSQGIANMQAAQKLTEVETALKGIDKNFANDSYEDRLNMISVNVNRGLATLKSEEAQGRIDQSTINDKIKIIQNEAINSVLQNTLTEAQTALTNAQTGKAKADTAETYQSITNMVNEIQQKWKQLGIEQQNANTQVRAVSQQNDQINVNSFNATTERMRTEIENTFKTFLEKHPSAGQVSGGMLNDMKNKLDKILNIKY